MPIPTVCLCMCFDGYCLGAQNRLAYVRFSSKDKIILSLFTVVVVIHPIFQVLDILVHECCQNIRNSEKLLSLLNVVSTGC